MLPMRLAALTALTALITASMPQTVAAQAADAPEPAEEAPVAPDAEMQAEQPAAMPRDMMRAGRYHDGMMRGMGRRGHMMKIMFAITDADGDGALSFEEISTIHKRVFDRIDADKDGKVTPEEVQTFMRE